MKAFLRRLRFFGVGFGIGLLFVFFFFQNRGCTWLPENRVKNTFLGRILTLSETTKIELKKKGLTNKQVISFLNDGDVAFGKSKKQGNPQVYHVEKEIEGKLTTLWFTLPKNSFVCEVLVPKGNIQKVTSSKSGFGSFIFFPKVKELVFLEHQPEFDNQLKLTNFSNESKVLASIKKSGKIDFSNSKLDLDTKPQHAITLLSPNKKLVKAIVEWNQDKIIFDGFEDVN